MADNVAAVSAAMEELKVDEKKDKDVRI